MSLVMRNGGLLRLSDNSKPNATGTISNTLTINTMTNDPSDMHGWCIFCLPYTTFYSAFDSPVLT